VNASSISTSDKAMVIAWLGNATTVCSLLRTIPDD
jgi:hypothetical protein